DNIRTQDQAAVESMGPIMDHSMEHLVPSDQMVARTRRRMVKAVQAFASEGRSPPGVDDPQVFARARSGFFLAPQDVPWPAVYDQQAAQMKPAVKAGEPA